MIEEGWREDRRLRNRSKRERREKRDGEGKDVEKRGEETVNNQLIE